MTTERIRLEKPDLVGWVTAEIGEKEVKFIKTISGNQVTLIPDGKIFWLEEEVVKIEQQRDRWQEIACALYNAAHEEDYRLMVSAMKKYEEAAGE
jgi:hypothetical protein